MKNKLLVLYLLAPVLLLFGWFFASESSHEFIRRDCLEGAIAIFISAVILTIGCLLKRVKESAVILQIIAIAYMIYIISMLLYGYAWSSFQWWHLPVAILLFIFIGFPAIVAYVIAGSIKKNNQIVA